MINMEKQPSVTVIVTVKNSRDTIENCVKSLLSLRYKNCKIYVTDAFSDDGTWEELEKIQEKYPKKIRLERIKGNIGKTHNHMIENCNTEFIAMTDADCVVDKNWLKNLTSGFSSKEVIATAGYCSTPRDVNMLQKLIGIELEDRFKHFPKFICRAPTMNICLRSNIAKKIKFDERFGVAQETDWGYRLTKFGKMVYIPSAIIWHYHRPTLKNFFKQQYSYGKFMPLLYLKHMGKSAGDHISKPTMILQEFIFLFASLFLILSLFNSIFTKLSITSFILLFILFFFEAIRLGKSISGILSFFFLFFFRTIAWTIGLIVGIFAYLKGKL
jgi:GT2 family glycosyltransferase